MTKTIAKPVERQRAMSAKVSRLPGMMPIPEFRDSRGSLLPLERGILPFDLARVFFVKDIPAGAKRGGHRTPCDQFLLAVSGSCNVAFDDGKGTQRIVLKAGTMGLYLPRGTYVELDRFRDNAVVLVACSERFVPRSGQLRT
jgi:hypothetical protein